MKRTVQRIIAAIVAVLLSIGPVSLQAFADGHLLRGALSAHKALLLDKEPVDLDLVARLRLNEFTPLSLEMTDVPDMQPIVNRFLNGEAGKHWAIVLGKAFFWDMGSGSDDKQGCASCHFKAGADSRSKNQINPGANATLGLPGINFQLSPDMFPISRDIDDTLGSQGVFAATFTGTDPQGLADQCTPTLNDFNITGTQVRQTTGRDTPSVVNAVFNHRNFWDGRANNFFNGVDPFGVRTNIINPIDPVTFEGAGIWERNATTNLLEKVQILLPNSSLASQAVGPPLSDVEMSCAGRTFPDLGKKMLRRSRPLQSQRVATDDSVLGPYVHPSGLGLSLSYKVLIENAFKPAYFSDEIVPGTSGLTQAEANFALIWGLAIQFYEATLVSNQTPFDDWARGNDYALTQEELEGLEIFISLETGLCVFCHGKQEFTLAAVRERTAEPKERMFMAQGPDPAVYDGGFYNIGASLTADDIGIGATIGEVPFPGPGDPLTPIPLCWSRQAADGPAVDPESNPFAFGDPPEIAGDIFPNERVACDGAFKVPTLRNAELTAPYFHNGSHATLEEVMESYSVNMTDRFANENIANLAPDIPLINITGGDETKLIAFIRALTDQRVLLEKAPFDHPELIIHDGHIGDNLSVVDGNSDGKADDAPLVIPAVGAGGRSRINNVPPQFLGIQQAPRR